MKPILILLTCALFSCCSLQAQNAPANELAKKIADKMMDSLVLTQSQRSKVFAINMRIHQDKMEVRRQYQSRDSVGRGLQLVENKRDSLYRGVLDATQFSLYQQKKRNLVNNN